MRWIVRGVGVIYSKNKYSDWEDGVILWMQVGKNCEQVHIDSA